MYLQPTHHTIRKKQTNRMASTIRFPFTSSVMLQNQVPNKKVAICLNPDGTKPVPYENYEGSHPMGRIVTTDGKYTTYYLMWYVWEFLGHLWYLSNDFESFMLKIVEKENSEREGKNDFATYFGAMMNDTKSVYNRHLYAHFQVMWIKCNNDNDMWNLKLSELREHFNAYIQKRMIDYESQTGEEHPVFVKWKKTLEPIYGENWSSYLWQCTNFDELGQFITEHNKFFRKNENAKEMICKLNLPEEKQNFATCRNEQLVKIDDNNNIVIWGVGVIYNNKTYVCPATPDRWTTGSSSLTPMVSTRGHFSIFPPGASSWLNECKSKDITVKWVVLEGDLTSTNYESYTIIENPKNITLVNNKSQLLMRTMSSRPVCGKNESLCDFADV
tara:strand:- start:7640 stop:8797 length:1158 start_codon:yes stop_codon:yes gene_type:complete